MQKIETYWWLSIRVKEQTSKKSNKKEPPKKTTKTDVRELNKLITKEETDMNNELFKRYFNLQMPTAMLKDVYTMIEREIMS